MGVTTHLLRRKQIDNSVKWGLGIKRRRNRLDRQQRVSPISQPLGTARWHLPNSACTGETFPRTEPKPPFICTEGPRRLPGKGDSRKLGGWGSMEPVQSSRASCLAIHKSRSSISLLLSLPICKRRKNTHTGLKWALNHNSVTVSSLLYLKQPCDGKAIPA